MTRTVSPSYFAAVDSHYGRWLHVVQADPVYMSAIKIDCNLEARTGMSNYGTGTGRAYDYSRFLRYPMVEESDNAIPTVREPDNAVFAVPE